MEWIGAAAALVVGGVFVVAGASKLAAGPVWTASARDLRAPDWSVPLVPWVELVVGSALAVQLAPPYPAVAAIVLLVGFSGLIVARLRAGERPPCACFGQWSATPIGAHHLVRNGVLAGLAVVAGVLA
jgi:hypothetical protein